MEGKHLMKPKKTNAPFVSSRFSPDYLKKAHDATFAHESVIRASDHCVCFYCGHSFKPSEEEKLFWIDERPPRERTLRCPMCAIDCVIGSASSFPIDDPEFVLACSEAWFSGISRISDGKPVEKLSYVHLILD
jgi:hypothetical protein